MDPMVLRFIERLAAVLIGGMSIFLGYRLFHDVPEAHDSSGKLEAISASIVLTHVGPGVFFALFGAVAIGLSLFRPLQLTQGTADRPVGSYSYVGSAMPKSQDTRADDRVRLRKEMLLLNSIPATLRQDLPGHERDSVLRGIARAKLGLMKPVWGTPEEGFGEFSQFERWVQEGELSSPPAGMEAALELYNYGRPGGRS